MKITKVNTLTEALLTEAEDNLDDVSLATDSASDIADAIQTEVAELSDGEKGISDANAEQVAAETKQAAAEVNADEVAIIITADDFDDVKIENRLYRALNRKLRIARTLRGRGDKAGLNIMVDGLPGSGKTAIVESWCAENGLVLVPINATDQKLDSALNGIPLRDLADDKGKKLDYAYAMDKFAPLIYEEHPENEGKCILFVDEFNRQKSSSLRRPLMSVFNEKRNSEGNLDFRKNLLFSVVCINPTGFKFYDKGTDELNPAEDNRFTGAILDKFDSNKDDAQAYWDSHTKNRLLKLGIITPGSVASKNHGGYVGPVEPLSPSSRAAAEDYIREYVLATTILQGPGFTFQNRENWEEIGAELEDGTHRYNPLTSRSLTDYIEQSFGNPEDFLYIIDEEAHVTPNIVKMMHDLVDPASIEASAAAEIKRYKLDRFDTGSANDDTDAEGAADAENGTNGEETIIDQEDNPEFLSGSNINSDMPIDDAAATVAKILTVTATW